MSKAYRIKGGDDKCTQRRRKLKELGGMDTEGNVMLKLFLWCNRLVWIQMAQGRGWWRTFYRCHKIWEFLYQ
jgi:hypothetical protein